MRWRLDTVRISVLPSALVAALTLCTITPLPIPAAALAEDLPLTRNVPLDQFQNRVEDQRPYDFNAPPQGMFLEIQTAQDVDDVEGFRRTQEFVPITPTDRFAPDAPVYIVFRLHQHYQGFKVFGLCYPDIADQSAAPAFPSAPAPTDPASATAEAAPPPPLSQDTMHIAMEDESGYLRLPAPDGGWPIGPYKVEIHVGEQISELTLMGTMRFTVTATAAGAPPAAASQRAEDATQPR